MYMEYAYAQQGSISTIGNGDLVNVDILQSPGSEIGVKGEEALGGGVTAWFQCASTADIRGSQGAGAGAGIFCGRNSAIGVKGSFGNVYVGNWDMPMKRTAGAARILSDTGIWGTGRMLFGDSSSFTANGSAANSSAFSRRQNSSVFYDTPVFSGFQGFFGYNSTTSSVGQTSNSSSSKPRLWSLAGTYTNGPLYLTLAYESHSNFSPNATATGAGLYNGTDTGWSGGAAYTFGPVKAGLLYTQRQYDMSTAGTTDTKVQAWNAALEWSITGPHALRGGYTTANNTKGTGVTAAATGVTGGAGGGFIANGGLGNTGGSIWQVQYVYNASKRTEFTAGYVALSNDSAARYALGGLTAPAAGESQSAFAISFKNRF